MEHTVHPVATNPAATARIAGVAYLAIILLAVFSEMVVRDGAIVSGDAAATASNILAREQLWRLAGAADFFTAACDVIVALLLYVLLKPVGRVAALLGAAFQLVLVGLSVLRIIFHMLPLSLLAAGDTYLSHFTPEQLQDLSYLSLRLHGQAYDVSLFFFGVHCLLIGWLIARANFLPRVFGWLLFVAGLCYVANTIGRAIDPQATSALYPWVLIEPFIAEAGLTLWLLFRGVNVAKWRAQAGA